MGAVLLSVAGVLAFRYVKRIAGVGAYRYLYACALSLLIAACSSALAAIKPEISDYAGPLVDISLAAFGILLASASGWLIYTFRRAGDGDD